MFGKRYSGYSGYSKKHPIQRDRLPTYLTKYFVIKSRSLKKKVHGKKTFKKSIALKLWSLISQKQQKTIEPELFDP